MERRPRRPDEHLGDLCSVREDPMFAVTGEDLNASQHAVQSADVMYEDLACGSLGTMGPLMPSASAISPADRYVPFSSSRQQCARASAQTSGAGWQTPMDFH